ncbi:hypothetical protein N8I77_008966 [Diaporthe amygdali]|uniref:Kelch repeat protein n=1 Tax=Phomopsis amygdali TaxID=1214568 RepID=A0AAD9W0E8_PHOAM|nr:hypothetical protein N8I77_008966 [Diaporthe amygdali]
MRNLCFSEVASVYLIVACWLHAKVACAAALRGRQGSTTPSPTDFVRRSFAVGTVLGDFVYIDGGEVSQVNQPTGNNVPSPVSSTLSINLREDWTNSTVPIQVIPKSAPVLNSQAIWSDESTNSFWIWGGAAADGSQPPPDQIWQFSADGNGGGSWSLEQPSNPRIFNELARPVGCAPTQGDGVGYCMGGLLTSQSNSSVESDIAVAGLVSFGMTSSVWTNTSIPRTLVNARAEFAPFGPNGLILLLGGTSGDPASSLLDFNNITFYDPITKQFFSQQATGTIPTGRQRFCSVGVAGPNKTYEVFLYGGLGADNTVSDEVFVLSLPGFVFAKADNPGATTARADHDCVAVGAGKRQMISIGGADASKGFPAEFADPDPWAQGLGVFDMTDLRWTDRYAHDAAAYDTPEVVKQFYRDGGLGKVQWTSSEVEGFFNNGTNNNNPGSSTSDGGGDNNNSNNNSNNNNNNANNASNSGISSGLSRQAILGISIGGSAALPILIAGLYFFCCRLRPTASRSRSTTKRTRSRRQPRRRSSDASKDDHDHVEDRLDASQQAARRSVESARKELLAPPSLPLERYSVHIKGNATPITIENTAVMTNLPDPAPEQQQPQQQVLPVSKRVRFSAMLKTPQRKPVPALQPQQALSGNPVTIHSELADRRGRPALQAIRTRTAGQGAPGPSGFAKDRIRVYQDRPS